MMYNKFVISRFNYHFSAFFDVRFFLELAWDCELLFFSVFYYLHHTSPSRHDPGFRYAQIRGIWADARKMIYTLDFFNPINDNNIPNKANNIAILLFFNSYPTVLGEILI